MNELNIDFFRNKPSRKVIDYDVDCLKLFSYLKKKYTNCYFFESLSLPRHQDRYYTIGFDPCIIFTANKSTLSIDGDPSIISLATGIPNKNKILYHIKNPYQFLKNKIHFNYSCTPHQGGLIGYFSHEAVNYFEPSLQLKEHEGFDTFKLGLYFDGLIYDTTTGTLEYYTFFKDRSEKVAKNVKKSICWEVPTELESVTFTGHSESRDEFITAVKNTREKIKQGYSFQAEVGFKSNYTIIGDKIAIYDRLRKINPSPYMFYIKFGEQELLGASPEVLISCKNGKVLTTPTAGTTTRGSNEKEDVRLARELLNDPKEIAEHNMLVDLHRNDTARVCIPGTVKVSDLMYIIKFSHVQHIVSNIIGSLLPDKSAFDVLETILPGGVVTGAPKIETIKIISENEKSPRGPYGGAVGRFSPNGDCDFCLPIRSIFCLGNKCYAQTSAGVVYDSIPEKEYIEVTNKLAAMKQTLEELGASR
ncbi:MAG: anthranilate synthase component I family protein [Candidatus Electrothrix sp. MAN1_4]|nr:anthranilate synthase component I family protein [Candidatus Electrothrix sp. MAN1_4]